MSNTKPAPAETTDSSAGMVVVRFVQEHLTLDHLRNTLNAVERNSQDAQTGVLIDFTAVNELVGAWSIHLALILHLARRLRKPVRLRGLHGQPMNVAWLYRRDPEVRALLGRPYSCFGNEAA